MRSRTLISLLAAGLIGCQGIDDPEAGWLVTTSVSAAEFSSGGLLEIRVVGHNVSSKSLRHEGFICQNASYRLRRADGTELRLPPEICLLIGFAPLDIAPGDSVVMTDFWDGKIRDGGNLVVAPPGDYSVVGRLFVPDEVLGSAATVRLK